MVDRLRAAIGVVSLIAVLASLGGCGQTGPLYLPDTTRGEVVTRPAQTPVEGSGTSPAPASAPEAAAPPSPRTDADAEARKRTTPPAPSASPPTP